MSAPNGVQAEVLQILSAHGALKPREILKHSDLLHDTPQVSNAICRLKADGLVERANDQCWRVTDAGRTKARTTAPAAPTQPAIKTTLTPDESPRPQDDIEPTRTSSLGPAPVALAAARNPHAHANTAQDALQRAAQQSQEALDAYVWEVGDAAVLKHLMAARDAARQALTVYEART